MPKKYILDILISKTGVIMNLSITTKNFEADPGIRFPTKSILQSFGFTGPFRQRGS